MPGNAPSYLRPGAVERILGHILAFLVWIGLIRGHFYVLEVRGRKSGKTISLPVDPLDLDGRRYLISPAANPIGCAMSARQAKSSSHARCAATAMPCASFPPASVRRFSKPILTASPARCSASFPSRRDRRWKRSTIWRRGIRSSSYSRWTRLMMDSQLDSLARNPVPSCRAVR
jgi:hypothetical protein